MDVKTGRWELCKEGREQGSVKSDFGERLGLEFCWLGQGTARKKDQNSEKDAN